MSIISISRDTNNNVSIVRMISSDTLSDVGSSDYILNNQDDINLLNGGVWDWFSSDMVLCSASDGTGLFIFSGSNFTTLIPYGQTGGGTINPGLQYQLAYYAANGTTLSGLTNAASSTLSTDAGGIPSWSQSLPTAVQLNIVNVGNLTQGTWSATPVDVSYGGTGNSTFTAYSLICAGITATGAFQNVVGVGTTGQVLTSNGASALPSWMTNTASGIVDVGTVNAIAYYPAATAEVAPIATADSSVFATSGMGVPGWTQTLPSAVQLQIGSFNSGTSASNTTFWRGDGTWASVGSSGITTIDGDTGSVTGSTITISGGSTGLTTSGSGTTLDLTGTLLLANGGTSASLTASNGGIFYSTATTGAILSGTATANQIVMSGSSAAPSWSTATYPATTTINQILYSSADNVITGLATLANGVLLTSASGVPELLANGTAGYVLTANSGAPPSWQVTSGALVFDADSGVATPLSNTINISGGSTGLTTTASSYILGLTGVLNLSHGGTNANLTANNGGIFYSTSSAAAILAGTSTSHAVLMSGGLTTPLWSTTSYPTTITANALLYGSATNVISGLTPAANKVLTSNSSNVPTWSTNLTVSNGGTGLTSATAYEVLCGGTTSTGNFQSVSNSGAMSGYVLTYNSSSSLPSWQSVAAPITPAALTELDDTNVTLTLGGTPNTALLQATSITAGWTGTLALTRGGTAASLTASNGGIVYSNASTLAILAGTATAGLALLSGASTTPTWSNSPPITQVTAQKFTATGAFTYTPTTGMQYIWVRMWASGAGGGGVTSTASQTSAGGGGCGGGYLEFIMTAAQIGASKTGSVGAAGAGGANTGGTGSDGATTVFADWTCNKGTGGVGCTAAATSQTINGGSSSGSNTVGTGTVILNINPKRGNGATTVTTLLAFPGAGGSSFGGSVTSLNPISVSGTSAQGGSPANNTGAGGAGSATIGGGALLGGAGADGQVLIVEYISV